MKGEEGKGKTAKCGHSWIAIYLEIEAVRKKLNSEEKQKQEENSSSPTSPHNLPVGMVVMGNCSLDWLREGGWCGRQNNNLTGKHAVRKKLEWWGKIKNKRKTHRDHLLHATGSTGMVVVCSCSLDWLREGGRRGWLNNNLTWKNVIRKVWNGKKIKTRGNSPSPSSPRNRRSGDGGGRTLFPWLTEGGWLVQWTGWQFDRRTKLWEKVWNGGKHKKG
jgi:hypothetical protein